MSEPVWIVDPARVRSTKRLCHEAVGILRQGWRLGEILLFDSVLGYIAQGRLSEAQEATVRHAYDRLCSERRIASDHQQKDIVDRRNSRGNVRSRFGHRRKVAVRLPELSILAGDA